MALLAQVPDLRASSPCRRPDPLLISADNLIIARNFNYHHNFAMCLRSEDICARALLRTLL